MANVTNPVVSKSEWRVGEEYYNENGRRIRKQTWQNSDGDQWDTFDDVGAAPSALSTPPAYQPTPFSFHSSGQTPGVAATLQAGTAVAGINPQTGTTGGISAGGPGTLSGGLAPMAPVMFGPGSSGPSAANAERQRATAAAADAERLRQEEVRQQRLRTAQLGLLGLAQSRQEAGTAAREYHQQYGLDTPAAIAQLQAKEAPLTREQASAQTGYAVSAPEFTSIWQALEAWYSSQRS